MKKKILFNGLGNRGWIGGLYYLKNILFSCLQNPNITDKFDMVVLIDAAHADIFDAFREENLSAELKNRVHVDVRVYEGTNKWRRMLYEMNLVWLHGVKYCYALELNRIGRFFKKKGIFWIPDFQHRTLPEFFGEEELRKKQAKDIEMVMSTNPMVLSSNDSKNDLEHFYPDYKCAIEVVHFVSYIEPELNAITPKMEEAVADKFDLHGNYIYLPNQFWQHKNHIVAVKAIEEIKKRGALDGYKFVFTGNLEDYRNPAYIDRLKEIMNAGDVKDSIRLLGFVDRTEQLCIMKNAKFLVQPSLCEGWGTVLEDAKVLDKAVLLSDIPVHREQKNAKCRLFDPHNPKELADLMGETAREAEEPERAAEFGGDVRQGIANMYREAKEYSKALERVFR